MRRSTALGLVAIALPLPAAHAAPRPGTFAGSLGVRVPKGAQADLRAIDRATGTIAAARTVGRSGRFSLSLAPGSYLMVGTVVTTQGRLVQKRIAVSLRSGQKRKNARLTARKRKRRPKARAAFIQERGQVTPGRFAIEIPNVTGSIGDPDWDMWSGGINDMLINEVLNGTEDCGTAVIEVERRDEILKELEFQQSPYVDPSTRLVRNLIIGDVELRGTVAAAPGDGAKVTMTIVDKASGKTLGSPVSATFTRDTDWRPRFDTFGRQVADELCKLSDVYAVTLNVNGEGRFATHTATGTIAATLRARRTERGRKVWRATGPLQWGTPAFATKTDCPYVDPVVPTINWSVTILDAGDGQLQVTWTRDGNDSTSASVDCPPDGPGSDDPPPIPGQPGTSLLGIGPESFLVPYAGGAQPVSGGFADGGDGWFNAGTITVTRAGVG